MSAARDRPMRPPRKASALAMLAFRGRRPRRPRRCRRRARRTRDRQPDLGAAELAMPRRAQGSRTSAGRLGVGIGAGRRRRRSGSSGAGTSSRAQPVDVAEQGRDLAAASRSRSTASRQPSSPSRAPIASDQVVSPVAQMWSPSRSRTIGRGGLDERPRRSRPVRRPDAPNPHVDGLDPGVGRDLGVRPRAGAPRRGSRPPATRRCPSAGTSAPRRRSRARGRVPEAGQRLVVPHRAHLARRTGQGDDDPAVGRASRTSRAPCRWGWAARSADGISQACLRLISGKGSSRRAHRPRSQRLELRVDDRRLAADARRWPRGSGRPGSGRGRRSRRRGRPAPGRREGLGHDRRAGRAGP